MNTNCLITKLKGVVNNDNLSFFNCICTKVYELTSPTQDTQYLHIVSNKPVLVEALDGGYFTNTYGGESIGSSCTVSNADLWFSNHTGRILIHEKDSIMALKFGEKVLITDFDFSENLFEIANSLDISTKKTLPALANIFLYNNSKGNIKNILNGNLKLIHILIESNPDGFKGIENFSLTDLINETNLNYFHIALSNAGGSFYNTIISGDTQFFINKSLNHIAIDKCINITGNIDNLAQSFVNFYNLKGTLSNAVCQISNTYIEGSIQSFVNILVEGGITSGTVAVPYIKTAASLYSDLAHTTLVRDDPSIPSNGNEILSWNSNKTWTIQ